jgi:hypothetical protein
MADNQAHIALGYIPLLLAQLDNDGREMLGVVLQAMRDSGYEDGYEDGIRRKTGKGA